MVRFACERCGKRYAIQGVPVTGRKYRVTCKACGHVIAFTGGEAAFGSGPDPSAAAAPEHPQATSVSELLPQAPGSAEPAATPSPGGAVSAAPAGPPALEPARAAGPSYIDLFDDHDVQNAPPPAELPVDGPPSWRDLGPRPTPTPAARRPVAAPAQAPARPPEARERTEVPHESRVLRRLGIAVAVIWVVVLAAAFGHRLWRRSQASTPPAPAVSTEASAIPGTPAPAAAPQAEPPPPEPAAPPVPAGPEAVAVAPQGDPADVDAGGEILEPPPVAPPPPAQQRPDRRPAPKPKPKVRKPAPERRAAPATAPVAPPPAASPAVAPPAPDATGSLPEGLAEKEIQKILAGARKSFQACLREPSRGLSEALGERQITLRFNVSPSGQVGYATIDDVEISSAPVGQCLKKAARGLVFPAFRGDPVRVDAPLSIPDR